MRDRTRKRVELGRERKVGYGEKEQEEEKWEKYQPTCTACDSDSY